MVKLVLKNGIQSKQMYVNTCVRYTSKVEMRGLAQLMALTHLNHCLKFSL